MKTLICILALFGLLVTPVCAFSAVIENIQAYNGLRYDEINEDNSLVYLYSHDGHYVDQRFFMTAGEATALKDGYIRLKITELRAYFTGHPSWLDKLMRGCLVSFPMGVAAGVIWLLSEDPYGYLYVPQTPDCVMHIGKPTKTVLNQGKVVIYGEGGWRYEKIC